MRRSLLSGSLLLILVLATGTIVTLASPAAPPSPPVPLPDTITSPSFGYTVRYINDNPYNPAAPMPGDDLHFMPDGQAQIMADAVNNGNASTAGNPNGYHTGYDDLGFTAPEFGDPVRSVFTFNCSGCDSGNAPSDRINMPAPNYIQAAETCIRLVMGHELFHHTQYSYITFGKWSTWGTMPVEGTARFMQDKIFSDLDANGGCITYRGEVNGFLGSPNQDIWQASYASALFWNYLSEQLGTQTGEPVLGADFVRTFWQQAQALNASPDVPLAIRQAISTYSNARSLEKLFQDFTIANYTKNMNLAAVANSGRYRYVDENDGSSGNYNNVPVTNATLGVSANSSVVRWGARYLQANVASCPAGVVAFKSTGDQAGYTLVGSKAGNAVDTILPSTSSTYARALLQRAASPYTSLAAVVTGLNSNASFNYLFGCGQVRLVIREPQAPSPIAYVGSLTAPEPFLIKLRVDGPDELGAPSVEGLLASDFQVYVGPEAPVNLAPVLTSAYVQGDYWLVAQAPAKALGSPTTYNLLVKLGDLASNTKEGAVIYEVKNVDQVLVIDKSGSMLSPGSNPKITAAKNAASLFVDSARSTDQTSVVSFSGNGSEPNDDAQMLFQLALANAANRTAAKNQINAIVATGATSIGDGLEKGRVELLSIRGRPVPPTERWIVLLSDGMENEAAFYSTVRPNLIAAGIKVNAIALGPQTDQVLMQAIAADTGGSYYYVDYPSARPAIDGTAARADAVPLALQLADAYAASAEVIQNHERLWEATGGLASGANINLNIPVNEGGIDDALFTVAFGDGSVKATLFRPNGSQVVNGVGGAQILIGSQHTTLRVGSLTPGTWRLNLEATSGSPQYRAILSGINKQGARLRLYFGAYSGPQAGEPGANQFLVGQPMPIFASLSDPKGPIAGAVVMATVEHPDGSSLELPLFDDGNHNDGTAGDGLYGGLYTRTTEGSQSGQTDEVYSRRGSYNVAANASGQDNQGQGFQRIARGSFSVVITRETAAGKGDSDQDGMPDVYENIHPCLKFNNPDSDQDPDADELTSGEEYKLGTDPCNPDTDGGGESDLSEVKRDANPFNPADDALPRPVDPNVISKRSDHMDPQPDLRPNANLIRYPANPAYKSIRLLRSTNPDGPFNEVAVFDAAANEGLYHDQGLTNGVTYYYRLQGVDLNGALSAPSHVFSGTPKADPFSPLGSVVIADHAAFVSTPVVKLTFRVDPFLLLPADSQAPNADPEASQVMISNHPSFSNAIWQTFTPTATWTLSPDAKGYAAVFVRFRDPSGNVSETYHDDVIVRGSGILGRIRLFVLLHRWLVPARPAAGEAGTLVRVLGNNELPPTYTDSNGLAVLDNLPPGTYDLWVERPGFQPRIIKGVTVGQNQTVDLGNFDLNQAAIYLPIIDR